MTRVRLRPAFTADELAQVYPTPHDHTRWQDHQVRVAMTAQFAHKVGGPVRRGADLSCGDGAILKALQVEERYFGDYAPGHAYTGPIEETIEEIVPVDLFVCCETLEHLDDPDLVLKAIRGKTKVLLLSTPVDAWEDQNAEHYWAWSRKGVETMLQAAGFDPHVYMALDFRPCGGDYCYGIWIAR